MNTIAKLYFFLKILGTLHLVASPTWMKEQIAYDLASHREKGFCKECLRRCYETQTVPHSSYCCLFTIEDNQIFCHMAKRYEAFVYSDQNLPTKLGYQIEHEIAKRIRCIYQSLKDISSTMSLPNTTFLVCIGDSYDYPTNQPIFVMSRLKNERKILFPDFDALAARYQVVEGIDLETTDFPIEWEDREDRVVWRGKTNQKGGIQDHNKMQSSRWQICRLGLQYPHLIDAGFTRISPHSSQSLSQFLKPFLSTEKIFSYKYQAWLDGGVSSYSNSGWRFYTGSTVLKSDSPYVQWYFSDMKPWIHFVPIKEDMSNLIEILLYLKDHETKAKEIAKNGLKFVRTHISKNSTYQYFHDLLWAYAALDNTCSCPKHGDKKNKQLAVKVWKQKVLFCE